jgi:hypothetical protein
MPLHRFFPIAVAVTLLSSAAGGTTWYVDDDSCPGPGNGTEADPFCSVQAGIDTAVDGDLFAVAPGTYVEALDLLGKAITLRGSNGPAVTILEGPDPNTMRGGTVGYSVVSCVSGEGPETVIERFTITAGTGTPNGSYTYGGGMHLQLSSPTIRDCRFVDNHATAGGGLYGFFTDSVIQDCVFDDNSAGVGGGLHIGLGEPRVTRCVFINNGANPFGGLGGGIQIGQGATVRDCSFRGNSSEKGGGLFGGGGPITVVNCLFDHNWAYRGGGMRWISGDAQIVNCTFAQNFATDAGGGAYIDHEGQVHANCIVWGNTPDQFSGPALVISSNVQNGWPGPGNIDADPLFADPANGDYRLLPGSPCIDAGDNTAVPEGVTTDLDGNPRFLEILETPDTGNGNPPIVDMGAYESLGGGCLAITSLETVCHGDGSTFTVNVQGLNTCTGGTTSATFTGSGGAPGEDFCATLIINTEQGGFCCSTQVCVPVPDCGPAPAPGDLDGDGFVGVEDFLALLAAWRPNPGHPADFDGDGEVGVTDFLLLLACWG